MKTWKRFSMKRFKFACKATKKTDDCYSTSDDDSSQSDVEVTISDLVNAINSSPSSSDGHNDTNVNDTNRKGDMVYSEKKRRFLYLRKSKRKKKNKQGSRVVCKDDTVAKDQSYVKRVSSSVSFSHKTNNNGVGNVDQNSSASKETQSSNKKKNPNTDYHGEDEEEPVFFLSELLRNLGLALIDCSHYAEQQLSEENGNMLLYSPHKCAHCKQRIGWHDLQTFGTIGDNNEEVRFHLKCYTQLVHSRLTLTTTEMNNNNNKKSNEQKNSKRIFKYRNLMPKGKTVERSRTESTWLSKTSSQVQST